METRRTWIHKVFQSALGHLQHLHAFKTVFKHASLRGKISLVLACLIYGGGEWLTQKWDKAILKLAWMSLTVWLIVRFSIPIYRLTLTHSAFNLRFWMSGLIVIYLYLHTRHVSQTISEIRLINAGGALKRSNLMSALISSWQAVSSGLKNYGSVLYQARKSKTLFWLLSPYLIMGLYQAKTKQWHKAVVLFSSQVILLSYILSVGVLDVIDFVALNTDFRPSTFNLVYGFTAIFILLLYVFMYTMNIRNVTRQITSGETGSTSLREDLRSLRNERLHVTLLVLPIIGVIGFTVIPLIFMISIAFTSYAGASLQFNWQGLAVFRRLVMIEDNLFTLVSVIRWTLIWAVLATFTNYFGGILLSLLINKKGVKGKKIWRTIFIITMATPQFVSLLIMNQMFAFEGPVNQFLLNLGLINNNINFWGDQFRARTLIIIVNMWVGIPYLMLLTSGILMNIPEDLYEAAVIEGASKLQAFLKITMPYMFYITTPLLLMQFVGNMNNFNVIYLLTQGRPYGVGLENAGGTDILITWLYQLTRTHRMYNLSAAIGIIIFILSASISISLYRKTASYNKEGEFS